ncbi:SEC-C domain-containing protein, partial [bacterium]|nr:SEC-C domain-containing protein [bacterium]
VTDDDKVMIVDEFTGRLMPGRRYSDGLHQALEAKENVRIERETQTLATITLQNFFRLYQKLAGMTGTAETEAGEFWEIYKLDVVVVPTNEPIRRMDQDDVVYRTRREKYNAIIQEIEQYHEEKLPVLVGTVSVEVSETLSRMLRRQNIRHSVLNAKSHPQEAEIVTRAGEPGMVTIATNMAGRGTDIKLGAGVIRFSDECIEELAEMAVSEQDRGREVFIHEVSHDVVKILSTLLGEKAVFYQVVVSEKEKWELLLGNGKTDKNKVIIIPKNIGGSTDTRVVRDNMVHVKARDFCDGGLHIIGTERHEARRIDRQLRGRSGRQGDPGSTRFYLSLEDDLMRLFGSERIAGVMDRLGIEEGEVITHPMITKSIERAQKRVEMRNFEIRKHLLEYDNVMNKQREVIYTRRRRALEGENLHEEILEMVEDFCNDVVEEFTSEKEYSDAWNWDGMRDNLLRTMLMPLPVSEKERSTIGQEEFRERLIKATQEMYWKKRRILGDGLMAQLERFATLKTIDERWKEHLYEMDQLKEGIGLRAYGQKDPLIEYKQEGFHTFTDMLGHINEEVLEVIFKAQIQIERGPESWQSRQKREPVEIATVHETATGMGFAGKSIEPKEAEKREVGKRQPVHVDKKVGRNEPCPCESGKKYKHCHGKSDV